MHRISARRHPQGKSHGKDSLHRLVAGQRLHGLGYALGGFGGHLAHHGDLHPDLVDEAH